MKSVTINLKLSRVVALIFGVVCLLCGGIDNELFCRVAFCDEADANKIVDTVRNYRITNGNGISFNEFESLLQLYQGKIPLRSVPVIWKEVAKSQKPNISLHDLENIVLSKRNAILICNQNYTSRRQDISSDGSVYYSEETECHHIFSKGHIFQEIKKRDVLGNVLEHYKESYDGVVNRVLNTPPNSLPDCSISPPNSFFRYWPQMNILCATMGLDSKKMLGTGLSGYDLVHFLRQPATVVFEKNVLLDGRGCVLLSDGVYRVYLCPELNFAVVRIDVFTMNSTSSSKAPVYAGMTIYSSTFFEDIVDVGNGVWFPRTIEIVTYKNGTVFQKITTNYASVDLNKEVEGMVFSDFIPDDTIVFDGVNNLTYRYGDRASINSLIKETAKSKRVLVFRYISIISGLALIIIALVMKYRQYRKNKRENENRTEEKK